MEQGTLDLERRTSSRLVSIGLTGFQAKNFKPFEDTGSIDIRGLDLFFGHNSSGKSALLSILPMLQQTTDDPELATPFVFVSRRGVDLGTFDEVAHNNQVTLDRPVWFGLRIGEVPSSLARSSILARRESERFLSALHSLELQENEARIQVAVNYNKKQRRIAITQFELSQGAAHTIFRAYRKTTAVTQPWYIEYGNSGAKQGVIMWSHFLPRLPILSGDKAVRPYAELLSTIASIVVRELRQVVHIGPLREYPDRAYRLTGESPTDVGMTGENWLNILLGARNRAALTSQVNEWLRRLGYNLNIEWGRQGYVHPMLTDDSGLVVSLKDVGFGISQLLPVLVQGFASPPGALLILEQPEVHLHPRAQAELSDMLMAIARRGVRLMVETHSEHVLLRLRRRLAESRAERLDPSLPFDVEHGPGAENVAVYFIERSGDKSTVRPVNLGDSGEFRDPPRQFHSFFSVDFDEVVGWTTAVAEIRRRENERSD